MKVSKGQSRPEIVAAAFLSVYMVLGSPFLYQVLIATQMPSEGPKLDGQDSSSDEEPPKAAINDSDSEVLFGGVGLDGPNPLRAVQKSWKGSIPLQSSNQWIFKPWLQSGAISGFRPSRVVQVILGKQKELSFDS